MDKGDSPTENDRVLSGQRGGLPCASQQLELLPRPKPISWRTTLGLREEEEDTRGGGGFLYDGGRHEDLGARRGAVRAGVSA